MTATITTPSLTKPAPWFQPAEPVQPATKKPTNKKRAPKKAPTPQLSASSPRSPFTTDTRPKLATMTLPGPRRAQEGRGGAVATMVALRCIIRSPLLAAFTAAIPARTTGRKAAVPDIFWMFYLIATRHLASQELLDQELAANWPQIRTEFWFEHAILLPDAKANGDIPNSDDLRKWRTRNMSPDQIQELMRQLTTIAVPLALAIRRSEGGSWPRPLHLPEVWDAVAVDGTTLDAPSGVRLEERTEDDGTVTTVLKNSRAKLDKDARVHHNMSHHDKKHGSQHGLCNVVACVSGRGSYTRVVLGLDIAQTGEGEDRAAMLVLSALYDQVGAFFPVLLYDKAMKPTYYQDLMAKYGIYCVNPNYARPGNKESIAPVKTAVRKVKAGCPKHMLIPLGEGQSRYGTERGAPKRTYVSELAAVAHETNGLQHVHHLAADDGAVYELDRPFTTRKVVNKTQLLETVGVQRVRASNGEYTLRLTVQGACHLGGSFTTCVDLRKTELDREGSLPRTSVIANVRVIPDASERFGAVYGKRNQIESFFSWLEGRFFVKDRHASWGRDNQILDLIGAALLENTWAWAHLAYRDPAQAATLTAELAAIGKRCEDVRVCA